jgi:site-specific DNA-methyltransferase (adenine-specific)
MIDIDGLIAEMVHGDAVEALRDLPRDSIDLTLSDIPYGISLDEWDVLHDNTNSALGGRSPAQEKMGSGFKRRGKPINGWSKADLDRPREYEQWCSSWAGLVFGAMKPGGSVLLFGGRRTIHRAITAMEDSGFLLRDLLAWVKPAAHHKAQSLSKLLDRRGMHEEARRWEGWRLGNLAPLYEPIAWFFKPYKIGGTITDNVLKYGVGAMNTAGCEQNGRSPCNVLHFDFDDSEGNHHEAQKPVALLEYLINLTTQAGQLVLDPFAGSGSTGVAAVRSGRRFLGIEQNPKHVEVARQRVQWTGQCAPRSLPTEPSLF